MKTLLPMLLAPLAAVAIGSAPDASIDAIAPQSEAQTMAFNYNCGQIAEQRTRKEEGTMVMTPRTTTGTLEVQ
jgi:hypothetical protein